MFLCFKETVFCVLFFSTEYLNFDTIFIYVSQNTTIHDKQK